MDNILGVLIIPMLSQAEMFRSLRKLHGWRSSDPVPEELRGWSYHRPPVRPRSYLGLSMHEVAYLYCPTKRDVYLRRIMKVKGDWDKPHIQLGSLVHKVVGRASRDVALVALSGQDPVEAFSSFNPSLECGEMEEYCRKLYKFLTLTWLSDTARSRAVYGGEALGLFPWVSEIRVDGSLLGLSNKLSIDALGSLALVEVKTGKREDFHKVGLTGYALAVESSLEVPVDFGFLVYFNGVGKGEVEVQVDPVYVSPDLRKEFLDRRDEVVDIVVSQRDPGMPPTCPEACPFYSTCNGR